MTPARRRSTRRAGRTGAVTAASHETWSDGWLERDPRRRTCSTSTNSRGASTCLPESRHGASSSSARLAEAAARPRTRASSDILRCLHACRASDATLDAFLFPSLHTWFPVLRGADGRRPPRHDRELFPAARCRRRRRATLLAGEAAARVRGATQLFTVSSLPRGTLGAHSASTRPARRSCPRRPTPFFREPPRPTQVRRAALARGAEPERAVLPLRRRDQPAQERRDPRRRVRAGSSRRARSASRVAGPRGERPTSRSPATVRDRIAARPRRPRAAARLRVRRDAGRLYSAESLAVVNPVARRGLRPPRRRGRGLRGAARPERPPAHRETSDDAALFFPPQDAALAEHSRACSRDDGLRRDAVAERCRAAAVAL